MWRFQEGESPVSRVLTPQFHHPVLSSAMFYQYVEDAKIDIL
jgi:hypothetical protein